MANPRPTDDPAVRATLVRAILDPNLPLVSEMREIETKTLVTKYPSDDHPFATLYNINLYRGCGHGCIYCDTRSACYGIIDISRIAVKRNAIELLERELAGKRKKGVISTGSMNDPYMPLEERTGLTRRALEVILRYGFGVHIITKSALVVRDIDILTQLKTTSHVIVSFSITTVDDALAKQLEPGASPPSRRLQAMAQLRRAGIHSGALIMPLLPGLTDGEENLKHLVTALKGNDAEYALPGCLTLRDTGRTYFYSRLAKISPQALSLTQRIYAERYLPPKEYANEVYHRASTIIAEAGLAQVIPKWRPAAPATQLSLW
jgi:DNA repair photolyase